MSKKDSDSTMKGFFIPSDMSDQWTRLVDPFHHKKHQPSTYMTEGRWNNITMDELEESLKKAIEFVQRGKELKGMLADAILQVLDDADYEFDPFRKLFRPRVR